MRSVYKDYQQLKSAEQLRRWINRGEGYYGQTLSKHPSAQSPLVTHADSIIQSTQTVLPMEIKEGEAIDPPAYTATPRYSQGVTQRLSKQAPKQLKTGLAWLDQYFYQALSIACLGIFMWRGYQLKKGADALAQGALLARDGLVVASVFVMRQLYSAYSDQSSATVIKENYLHSTDIVNDTDGKAQSHDNKRIAIQRGAQLLNLASVGVLMYSAYRFAIADEGDAKSNLVVLGGAMAIELLSAAFHAVSEKQRCLSMKPDQKLRLKVQGKSLAVAGSSVLLFVAAVILSNYNSGDKFTHAKMLVSAALCASGAALLSTVAQRTGVDMTESVVQAQLNDNTLKLNSMKLFGCCSVKQSNVERVEDLLFKAMMFSAVYTAKSLSGVGAMVSVMAHVVGVSVAGRLVAHARADREFDHHNEMQQVRFGSAAVAA